MSRTQHFVRGIQPGRAWLFGGEVRDTSFVENDIRRTMPRFQSDNFAANLRLLDGLRNVAREQDCSMAELALAWVLAQGDFITAIPGTTRLDHLGENLGAADLRLDKRALERCGSAVCAR